MQTRTTRTVRIEEGSQALRPPHRTWGWPHYLAIAGIIALFWEGWTLVAWLADGPFQVTEGRDTGSVTWWAARVLEGLSITVCLVVLWWVGRGCIRERRITFDAMFCIANLTMYWCIPGENFIQPVTLVSSNWVNVNAPCGHMPFVVNPDCGRLVDPWLFFVPLWLGGVFASTLFVCWVARRIKHRNPSISFAKLAGQLVLVGVAIDLALELTTISLGLWTLPAPRWFGIPLGHNGGLRYAMPELISGGVWFACHAYVRVFKDDKGRTFLERGLDHFSPRKRAVVVQLALVGLVQILAWTVGTMPSWTTGFINEPGAYDNVPHHLLKDVCDVGGVQKTRYGPCPGSSPGYRIPIRNSLPGKSP